MTTEAFFLPAGTGQRFCLFHAADTPHGMVSRGQVVYVHPFAEEMNKSRRMAALQARALAAAGFDVVQFDLLGCGDSSGDFGDASWDGWVQDVVDACRWLRGRADAQGAATVAAPPLWLWGLRAGCLLAAQAARELHEPCNFLFWAPTPSGKLVLQQFMRLKTAADLSSGNAKAVMDGLRADLAQGRPIEVAGYVLAASLANGLEQSRLTPPEGGKSPGRMVWFELSTRPDANLMPASVKAITEWENASHAVLSHLVNGPSFWQTTEIEDAPALVTATTTALLDAGMT